MRTALSRREREVMDIVYGLNEATAQDIHNAMEDQPSYSSVRTHLRILVEKGHLEYYQEGASYVYRPVVPKEKAGKHALKHVLKTFFQGSASSAVAALLDTDSEELSKDDFDELSSMIEKAKQEGK